MGDCTTASAARLPGWSRPPPENGQRQRIPKSATETLIPAKKKNTFARMQEEQIITSSVPSTKIPSFFLLRSKTQNSEFWQPRSRIRLIGEAIRHKNYRIPHSNSSNLTLSNCANSET